MSLYNSIHNDKVVGYVLSMLKDFRNAIVLLEFMFVKIDTCINPKNSISLWVWFV